MTSKESKKDVLLSGVSPREFKVESKQYVIHLREPYNHVFLFDKKRNTPFYVSLNEKKQKIKNRFK